MPPIQFVPLIPDDVLVGSFTTGETVVGVPTDKQVADAVTEQYERLDLHRRNKISDADPRRAAVRCAAVVAAKEPENVMPAWAVQWDATMNARMVAMNAKNQNILVRFMNSTKCGILDQPVRPLLKETAGFGSSLPGMPAVNRWTRPANAEAPEVGDAVPLPVPDGEGPMTWEALDGISNVAMDQYAQLLNDTMGMHAGMSPKQRRTALKKFLFA